MSDPEAFLRVLRTRRSIRRFRPDPVPRETLATLIEAASWAPSAGNRQDWRFTVACSGSVKARMAEVVMRRWQSIVDSNRDLGVIEEVKRYSDRFADFADAPAVIVVSAPAAPALQKHLLGEGAEATTGGAASAAMAAQNLMLAAHASGLGACCMTGALAAREEIARILKLEPRQEIVCLVAVGAPDEAPSAPARKPVEEIARFLS